MKTRAAFFLSVLFGLGVTSCSNFQFVHTLDEVHAHGLCWIAAHKGNQKKGFENGADAIRGAIAVPSEIIEIDLRSSLDGEVYLSHPFSVKENAVSGPREFFNRTIRSLTSREVESLHLIGLHGEAPLRYSKALELIKGSSSLYLLDIKDADFEMVKKVYEEANRAGELHQNIFQFYRLSLLKESREHSPEMLTACRAENAATISQCVALNPSIIVVDPEHLEIPELKAAKAAEIRILVKVLNRFDSRDQWKSIYKKGGDILLTDHPEALKIFIEKKGKRALCG
jgi:glycerophosphoryl diester phosphodiesterase